MSCQYSGLYHKRCRPILRDMPEIMAVIGVIRNISKSGECGTERAMYMSAGTNKS